jgi:hypothetical protein
MNSSTFSLDNESHSFILPSPLLCKGEGQGEGYFIIHSSVFFPPNPPHPGPLPHTTGARVSRLPVPSTGHITHQKRRGAVS